ncbi:MAG: hypothetical protein ACYTXY_30860, partial [Nostoc sp.]
AQDWVIYLLEVPKVPVSVITAFKVCLVAMTQKTLVQLEFYRYLRPAINRYTLLNMRSKLPHFDISGIGSIPNRDFGSSNSYTPARTALKKDREICIKILHSDEGNKELF